MARPDALPAAEVGPRTCEEQFSLAYDQAPLGVALVGPDGRLMAANPALCRALGYDAQGLTPRDLRTLTHPDDLPAHDELFDSLVSGARDYGRISLRYVHSSGDVMWADVYAVASRDMTGRLRCVIWQMQPRAAQRHAAAEDPSRDRAIFEGAGDGIFVIDLEGRVTDINPAACRMYGVDHDEVVGRHLAALIETDYHPLFDEMLARTRQGEAFIVQAVDRRRDGSRFHVEVHGSSITYAGEPHLLNVVRDISERVRSLRLLEQRIQARTRAMSTLLQISRDVASTLQLEPLLAKALDLLAEVIVYDAAAVFALEGGHQLTLLDYRGPRPRSELGHRWNLQDADHIRMVMDHRQPLSIPNVRGKTLPARAWQRSWGTEMGGLSEDSSSWLGVPLQVKNRLIGTLTLEHAEIGHFSPLDAKLALAFANHVAVAIENARLYEASQRLGMLEEPQRIARELHDSVSQALYGIGLGARTAREILVSATSSGRHPRAGPDSPGLQTPAEERDPEALWSYAPEEALEPIEYVLTLAESGLADMRALLLELRPDALEHEGLVSSLEKQVAAMRRRHPIDIAVDLPEEPNLPPSAKEALYRIAQEALANIVKHADAGHVRLSVDDAWGTWWLVIQDDGVGFDPDQTFPGHFGLQSMRERVERLGGRLIVESARGQGTVIRAGLPADQPPSAHLS